MIDINELMRLAEMHRNPMNEVSISIPSKGKSTSKFRITVRSKYGGGGHSGNISQHGCSIKFGISEKSDVPLVVPLIPYEEMNAKDARKIQEAIKTMYQRASKSNSKYADVCLQFAYDNQAAIVALWNCHGTERSLEGDAIISYIEERVTEVDYFSAKRKTWKTKEEYDADVLAVNRYVSDYIKRAKESTNERS